MVWDVILVNVEIALIEGGDDALLVAMTVACSTTSSTCLRKTKTPLSEASDSEPHSE